MIGTMFSLKLIFSFASGVEFAIDRDELPDLAVIKFGQGFNGVETKFGDMSIEMMKPEMSKSVKPIVEFGLKSVEEPPMPKKDWIEKDLDIVMNIGITPRIVFPLTAGFEIGSDPKSVQLTKAQERRHSQGILKTEQPRQHPQQYGLRYSQPSQQSFQQRTYKTNGRQGPKISDRLSRVYSFKDEAVPKMFRSLMKIPEFRLPEPKKPEEMKKEGHPGYCPYHRMLGHTIEGCIGFKVWLEKNFKNGNITIPEEYLK